MTVLRRGCDVQGDDVGDLQKLLKRRITLFVCPDACCGRVRLKLADPWVGCFGDRLEQSDIVAVEVDLGAVILDIQIFQALARVGLDDYGDPSPKIRIHARSGHHRCSGGGDRSSQDERNAQAASTRQRTPTRDAR
jgi:hypothetical protein